MAKTLRQLIKERPTADELEKIRAEMSTLHDRAAAILSVAHIETALEDLLVSAFRPLSKSERAELFDGEAPLGSLSAKIKMAHAMSLLGSGGRINMLLIKDIRNVFAHAGAAVTFATPEIVAACARLTYLDDTAEALRKVVKSPPEEQWPPREPRDKYIATCALMSFFFSWGAQDREQQRAKTVVADEPAPSQ